MYEVLTGDQIKKETEQNMEEVKRCRAEKEVERQR